ncbi:MAG: hypothetical protein GY765_28405 [bacterium]|nr:hypothetical protein [bacterium]
MKFKFFGKTTESDNAIIAKPGHIRTHLQKLLDEHTPLWFYCQCREKKKLHLKRIERRQVILVSKHLLPAQKGETVEIHYQNDNEDCTFHAYINALDRYYGIIACQFPESIVVEKRLA